MRMSAQKPKLPSIKGGWKSCFQNVNRPRTCTIWLNRTSRQRSNERGTLRARLLSNKSRLRKNRRMLTERGNSVNRSNPSQWRLRKEVVCSCKRIMICSSKSAIRSQKGTKHNNRRSMQGKKSKNQSRTQCSPSPTSSITPQRSRTSKTQSSG